MICNRVNVNVISTGPGVIEWGQTQDHLLVEAGKSVEAAKVAYGKCELPWMGSLPDPRG